MSSTRQTQSNISHSCRCRTGMWNSLWTRRRHSVCWILPPHRAMQMMSHDTSDFEDLWSSLSVSAIAYGCAGHSVHGTTVSSYSTDRMGDAQRVIGFF